MSKNENPISTYAKVSQLAFVIITPLLLFIGGGWFLSKKFGWPDWAQMLLVLPLSAVAWPLAVLVWKDARTPRLVWRAVFALALVSILPVLLFLAGV